MNFAERWFALLTLFVWTAVNGAGQKPLPENCLFPHPANDRFASYSPDGRYIVFESDRTGNWDIFIWDKTNGRLRQITADSAAERSPAWHPSGKKVLFESWSSGNSRFIEFDLEQNTAENLSIPDLPAGNPMFGRYSPDGAQLAFSLAFSDTVAHLFVVHCTTKKWRQLTNGPARHVFPAWTPDGKCMVFHARRPPETAEDEIYRLHLKTGNMRRLTQRPGHDFCPAVSPGGKCIAYVAAQVKKAPEIFIMKKKGKGHRQITQNDLGEVLPSWSPDGRRLLVTAWRAGNYEICEIGLD